MTERRVALVTGASRGIGQAVAIELGRRGLHVVLTARTQGGLEAADDAIRAGGGTATLLPLDLTDTAQAERIGLSVHARFGRLDVLVLAAGALGALTPVPHLTQKDFSALLALNLAANVAVIRGCDGLLRLAPAGRAVVLYSSAAAEPQAYWGGYGATQAALRHLILSWAAETAGTDLQVRLVDPGPVETRLRRAAYPGGDPAARKPDEVAAEIADLCM